MEETFGVNIWSYLIQVAPVVFVMGVAIKTLWSKNNDLIDKMRERDESNLETLQQLSLVLSTVKDNGYQHTAELKSHIDDRINNIKDILRHEQKSQ